MRETGCLGKMLVTFIVAALLVVSNAIAAPSAQMTELEKKLYEGAKKEGEIIWWDTGSLRDSVDFLKAFYARYPGIKVTFYEINAVNTDAKYFMEHKAGRNPADVLHIDGYRKFKNEGLLLSMADIIKDTGYPAAFTNKEFDAIGIEHNVKGVAYNSKLVAKNDVPHSWEDLLHPRWEGKIAMDYQLKLFAYQDDTWGEEKIIAYLHKMRKQNPMFSAGVTKTMTLLGAGEFLVATDSSLGVILKGKEDGLPVAWAPIGPVVSQFNPHVLIRDAPHPNGAKLFLRWLMTAEGLSLVDKVRQKGSPLPGAGTAQSKALEQTGVKLLVAPIEEGDILSVQKRLQEAIGYSKGKLKYQDKK